MAQRKIVCMASFPKRYNGMIERLGELCKQCDQFQLYLDGYEDIPEEIWKFQNCIPICDGTNLHDKGKFYGIDKFKDDYVLTVDDDFSYPNNYVDYMCNKLDTSYPNSVITLLGVTKDTLQYVFPCDASYEDRQAILAGTGFAAFIPNNIQFFPQLKDLEDDNFGADAVLSMHCRDNNINTYIIQKEKDFVKLTRYVGLNWHNDKFNASKYKEYDVNWVCTELTKTSISQ